MAKPAIPSDGWDHLARWHLEQNVGNVSHVISSTERDDEGIDYSVSIRLADSPAYEQGEDEQFIWGRRVDFGRAAAERAGGSHFVEAARDQEDVANEVWRATRKAE